MSEDNVDMRSLRSQIVSLEEKNKRLGQSLSDARQKINELSEQLGAATRPPSSFATFLAPSSDGKDIDCYVGNRKMSLATAGELDASTLRAGQEVRLNEELVAVEAGEYEQIGQLAHIDMLLSDSRALVALGVDDVHIMRIAGNIDQETLNVGDTVMVDTRTGFILEQIERPDVAHLLLEEVPNVAYEDIGGLKEQIEHITDAIELPFTQPELYRSYGLRPPKGILLYGPPGCGKTLIAKAVATSLAAKADEGSEQPQLGYFLNIKGPQLLNKYVGETERQIREIFARARDRASRGIPVVVFFDEMEALFRTRGSGISSDVERTVVPQLLAEIDGVESLDNVIVIGASNREDMIDPAILRPGRFDVKIRIDRPDHAACLDIVSKYLTARVPLHASETVDCGPDKARENMGRVLVDAIFERGPQTEYAEILREGGAREKLYIRDVISGAMLARIIGRGKELAIKDYIRSGESGLSRHHLVQALAGEVAQLQKQSHPLNTLQKED